jgi:hypothetical protein
MGFAIGDERETGLPQLEKNLSQSMSCLCPLHRGPHYLFNARAGEWLLALKRHIEASSKYRFCSRGE